MKAGREPGPSGSLGERVRRASGRLWLRGWRLAGGVGMFGKIMGIVVLEVVALALVISWYVTGHLSASLEEDLRLRGIAVGNGLAAHAATRLLTDDLYELHRLARDALGVDPAMRYVFLEDRAGRVVVHTFRAGFPADLLSLCRPGAQGIVQSPLETGHERLLDIAIPVPGPEMGRFHLGLGTQSVQAALREHIRFLVLAVVLVLVPGLVFAASLAGMVGKALQGVAEAAESAGRGDLGRRAPVWAPDELGRVAQAFNEMLGRLEASRDELLRRQRQLLLLNATARATSCSRSLDDVLLGALAEICRDLPVSGGRVCVFPPGQPRSSFHYRHGGLPALVRDAGALPGSPCSCAGELGERRYLDRMRKEDRDSACSLRRVMAPEAAAFDVCLALRARDRLLGVMHLDWVGPEPPVQDVVALLTAVSEQVSLAVENAALCEDLRDRDAVRSQLIEKIIVAQEEERRRVAQELHDEAGQVLTSLLIELQAMALGRDGDGRHDRGAELRGRVAQALGRLQGLARELRPAVLDDQGLVPALRRHTADFGSRCGLDLDFQSSGLDGLRLAPHVETAVYRIVQEAMTNVARHSGASSASVVLTVRDGRLVAIVEDDGTGFDEPGVTGRTDAHLGLVGMRERAALVGASLEIESARGCGTTVRLEIPLAGNRFKEMADA